MLGYQSSLNFVYDKIPRSFAKQKTKKKKQKKKQLDVVHEGLKNVTLLVIRTFTNDGF